MARKKNEEKVLDMNANMQGTVVFSESVNLRINGNFTGELKTKGILFIGKQASVDAQIEGEDITIAGKVKGNIMASKRLSLLESASVEGEIFTKSFEIKEGAVFEGVSHMKTKKVSSDKKMTLKEVAEYLDIESKKIEEWAKDGNIPAVKESNTWVFQKNNIDEWIKTNA